jgi:hydroxymethylpyrimidine/phosphomethylpyrimidine kinase
MKTALTVAGSDCSGGAGIQADLKTFCAFRVYGMSVVTAVVAENTVGVQGVHDLPVDVVLEQIRSCLTDIPAHAVKVGMLSNPEIVRAVAGSVREFALTNVVVDPVMVAKSGDLLLSEAARETLLAELLPRARVITPNRFEAEVLTGRAVRTLDDMRAAAARLREIGCEWVVVKGGHAGSPTEAIDVVYDGERHHTLRAPRLDTPNTHGTGCTFSAAIAAGLARGYAPLDAIRRAKEFTTAAIESGPGIGHGHGPTNHLVGIEGRW